MIGQTIAHYKILEKLGAGGMGEVFLAEDTKLERKVALKFLPPGFSADSDFKARFKHEAQATAALNHPHIITVHDIDEHDGRMYLALEYVPGKTLEKVIETGKLKLTESLDLISQVCEGLTAAHKAGVVHRDIKPSNILISDESQAKILDFGLAKMSGVTKLTKEGSTLGTLQYQSPEQSRGEPVDERSDIFSVGVTLYEMITGHLPFESDYDAAVRYSISYEAPEPLARYKSGVPGELQRIVDKALAKDPAHRYQHADEMLADLRRLKTDSGQPTRSRVGLWIAAAAVVVVGLAGYFLIDSAQFGEKPGFASKDKTGWQNSIAVLPLRNLSPDPDKEYFCDGMTDALIGKLSGIKGLKVISMTSVLRYKTSEHDLKKIGHDLQVNTILEGSIQLEGDMMRLQAQLINVSDDSHIWSHTYERELKSIFAVQDDISRAIVAAMKIELMGEETNALKRRYTENIEAFDSYTRGRQLWIKRDHKNLLKSIAHFERAIELDPNYALAYSGLADAWVLLQGSLGQVSRAESMGKAKAAAETALRIDENLAEAHASLGTVYYLDASPKKAEAEFQRSIELNPGYFWSHYWYALLLERMARYQDGLKQEEIAFQINPMSIALVNARARRKIASLEWQEAEQLYRRMMEIEPDVSLPYLMYSRLLVKMDKHDESIRQAKLAVLIDMSSYNNLAYRYEEIGKFDSAIWAADKAIELAPEKHNAFDTRADIFAMNGMLDSAIASYSVALELKPDFTTSIRKLGNMYLFTQEYAKAESLYQILASDSNKNTRASGRLCLTQIPLHQGKFKEGLRMLNELRDKALADSLSGIHQTVGTHKRAAIYQVFFENHELAISEYKKVLKRLEDIEPNHWMVAFDRGLIASCFAALHDIEKADRLKRELERDLEKYGPTALAHFWWSIGWLEMEKGNFNIASEYFEKAVKASGIYNLRQLLALSYQKAGRIDDALEVYEKIINRYNQNRASWPAFGISTHFHLAGAYEEAGRYDDAIKQYEIFLDIWRDADDGIKMIEDAKERLAKLKS